MKGNFLNLDMTISFKCNVVWWNFLFLELINFEGFKPGILKSIIQSSKSFTSSITIFILFPQKRTRKTMVNICLDRFTK